MKNDISIYDINRNTLLTERSGHLVKVISFSIEPDNGKVYSNISFVSNIIGFPQFRYNKEEKRIDFNMNEIIRHSNKYFSDSICEIHSPKIVDSNRSKNLVVKLYRSLSESMPKNKNPIFIEKLKRSYSQRYFDQQLKENDRINPFVKEGLNSYIYTNINIIINRVNINKKLKLTEEERNSIYTYISEVHHLKIPENPRKILTSTILSAVVSNKSVLNKIKNFIESNNETKSSSIEDMSPYTYSISDTLFKHYNKKISIDDIRATTQKAINHVLSQRKNKHKKQ